MLEEIAHSGVVPRDVSMLRIELRLGHNIKERLFLLDYIPPNSIGAELGVFTGLFSSVLAREKRISQVTFVDPWWEAFGERYPNWGAYTDYGRLKTRNAFEIARQRVLKPGLPNRVIEVDFSYNWLTRQPSRSLDWVYLDSTHMYEDTKRELELLDEKLGDHGMILGDDWLVDRNHYHHGVFLAANEFLKSRNFELVSCGQSGQWVMRRAPPDTSMHLIRYKAGVDALQHSSPTDYDRPDYDDPNSLSARLKSAIHDSVGGFKLVRSLARWVSAIVAMRIHTFCLDALQARAPSRGRWAVMVLWVADQSWWLALEPASFRLVRWAKRQRTMARNLTRFRRVDGH
jgi:hypothetical protein